MRALAITIAVVVATSAPARAEDATGRHLLAGVRAFKAGRYEEALVELRIVARAPDAPADLAFYLGPTLYKLGRYGEAVDVFVSSRAERDALSDFYLGEAYYQLRMFRKARAVFAGLRTRGLGPALDEAAGRYVDAVDAAFKAPVGDVTIDYYIDQAREIATTDPVLAGELYDEARQLELLGPARPRHAEILAGLGASWNATGRPQAVVDALAGDRALSAEGSWQLARAFAGIGDAAHARPLLDALVRGGGPHAGEAGELVRKLPP